ncbi:CopG family ribbon-helix-helix protein [Pelagibacterium mangrovi]|uniref:CopG family ribbon-helix-helix protein n=1 Tax=Pelagibacterium mangrovi TaxID=3119828 RepID=UPI002FC74AA9
MAESTFTFRVDEDLKKQFAEIAKSKDRTGAQLIRDFMREAIAKQQEEAEYDAWFRAKVQQGLDDAAAGRVYTSEEVEEYFAKLRAELLEHEETEA